MTLQTIRSAYKVQARPGQKILYSGGERGPIAGTICGAVGRLLKVRRDDDGAVMLLHPTWQVEYLAEIQPIAESDPRQGELL